VSQNDPTSFLLIAYTAFFVIAIFFSFLINGLLLKFSRTLGNRQIEDRNMIRWSNNVKPSVGGISFYILFLFSISIYGIFNFSEQEYLNKHLLGMVFAVTTAFLLGLADDAYNTIPLLKFFSQLFCGIFLVVTGSIIPVTGIYFWNVVITLLWVVGIMNSINMLDNMDGVSGIVTAFIMLACFLVLLVEKNAFSFYSLMLIGVAGAVTGFLYFNWHPARIYMGDTGSQFLGAFIAALSIPILWKYHEPAGGMIQLKQLLIPLVAFIVPITDTVTVCIRRVLRGHSPFIGGKDHIAHHFVYAGLKERQVIFVLGGCSLFSAGLTAFLIAERTALNPLIITAAYSYFVLFFIVVQYFYNVGIKKERARLRTVDKKKQEGSDPATQTKSAMA
jgi:UDP-GlcNAc:undecaprenyl-phosphate/decaprenyl-phosphate GlcNAc-1-phosphate transferase